MLSTGTSGAEGKQKLLLQGLEKGRKGNISTFRPNFYSTQTSFSNLKKLLQQCPVIICCSIIKARPAKGSKIFCRTSIVSTLSNFNQNKSSQRNATPHPQTLKKKVLKLFMIMSARKTVIKYSESKKKKSIYYKLVEFLLKFFNI